MNWTEPRSTARRKPLRAEGRTEKLIDGEDDLDLGMTAFQSPRESILEEAEEPKKPTEQEFGKLLE